VSHALQNPPPGLVARTASAQFNSYLGSSFLANFVDATAAPAVISRSCPQDQNLDLLYRPFRIRQTPPVGPAIPERTPQWTSPNKEEKP